ncbi:molybdopterin nucleotidyltransferase [Syntrophotalea carbinolica DSM 2380]|uniref:Molybdenum cofactor guanylyltransferase n=1 Tax=Syntrophotalea carbinolica (strain DSM 2380 / NBRC 103641 / GraBd1) TaxID=338963 RepID=MOBA_SYNC1|nr:molybdenum cofactor guanylyltransferase [Syntrophotalea carbinolica]Q3A3H7.1 RecName: Full=Molybdenum cofactor guanylyltransferase; Short=MoCo guanylyltransferase; AltName: Full=GTP:molybdopterin guanylyltransferase; AltName: Full=Mo-MPT guanylyltransferase; AltName: Full=Molybdopterin guanylyltransferase; AltName: Full=Molybdopterin-guanine dinucleotide synthase; Short=MGD synthase [Syntrophotalea carbinolica DSM 2380]ABA89080.1 molybdopterin nucleotidyltransferase [Syntrophotalea carbinolica
MKFGSAVILAGGKSRRMGFDKQFLQVKNHYLLCHHGEQLAALFDKIIVVSNTPELYRETPFVVVSDEIRDKGPLGGIHIGLKTAVSDYVYFLACDMPNINLDYIRYMRQCLESSPARACITRFGDWIEPFNAFYSRDLVAAIEDYLGAGHHSLFRFLKSLATHYVSEQQARHFSPDWRMFLNLNTREDFEKWRRQGPGLGFHAPSCAASR